MNASVLSLDDNMTQKFTNIFSTEQLECICESLYQAQEGEKLVKFFNSDDNIIRFYSCSSSVTKAYLFALYHSGEFEKLCYMMSQHKFEEKHYKEMSNLWYESKYAEDQRKKKKALGPVEKYRLRKKFPPPPTISDGQEVIYSFRDRDRNILKQYYARNKYPSAPEKKQIAEQTGLHITQISNWFKNRRQRDKTPANLTNISPENSIDSIVHQTVAQQYARYVF